MGRSLGLLLVVLSLVPAAHAQNTKSDLTWMFAYRDKGENALAWDARFAPMLKANLPATPLPSWSNEPVNEAAQTFLGGAPGDIEVRNQRYVLASGCPAHACVSHGMLWVDTVSNVFFFVAAADEQFNGTRATSAQYPIKSAKLYITTKSAIGPDALPDDLCQSVVRWLHLIGALEVTDATLLTPEGSQPVSLEKIGWVHNYLHATHPAPQAAR